MEVCIEMIKWHKVIRHVEQLIPLLEQNINWNQSRINFLALIKVKNVNCVQIATAFESEAKKNLLTNGFSDFLVT